MSYAELERRSERLAARLQRLGVGPEIPVALLGERSMELIVALLAILKAGGVYVPLDPDSPDERLELLLRDSGAEVLVLAGQTSPPPCATACRLVRVEEEDGEELSGVGLDRRPAGPHNLAYLLYTSGSTGTPKGVAVTHRNIARLVYGRGYVELGPGEVLAQLGPVTFDASTFEIWGSLLHGARLVVMPPRLSLADIGQGLRQSGVSTLWLTAGLFHQMVEEQLDDLRGLRQLLAGGEALSVPHVQRALRELTGGRVINGYGPTESTTFACCYPMNGPEPFGASVPIGRPISQTRAHVLDRGLAPVPPGAVGEICLGGDGLARGYWGRPDLTAERFVPDPLATSDRAGGRLYRTGDLGRHRGDGALEFLGRLDHQVKIRGFRIEPAEIEAALARHPAVQDCVVTVWPSGGDRRLVAYTVARPPVSPAAGELRAFLQERLPAYMVPAFFVDLPALPRTPHGKIDCKALPAPDPGAVGAGAPPRNEVEAAVAGIWREVLGSESVGIHDDFFALGGHSLLATRAVSRLRDRLQASLSLQDFFAEPTVAGVASRIFGQVPSSPERSGLIAHHSATSPLSHGQLRVWHLDQADPGNPLYNIPLAVRLLGAVHPEALRASLGRIAGRHESLRTVFERSEGEPRARVLPPGEAALPLCDLRGLPGPRSRCEVDRLVAEQARHRFDLTSGPLWRATLLQVHDDEHVLLLNLHHIVADGWSLAVLAQELETLYNALRQGRIPPPLPELPIQSGDFARWQREWLATGEGEHQRRYWQERLQSLPQLELPLDRPRPRQKSHRGGEARLDLAAPLTGRLTDLAGRDGSTLFMVVLAAWDLLLSAWSSQDDLCVGVPVAGRTRSEIEPLIGYFMNTVVLRTDLSNVPSFRALLHRVRQVAVEAFENQDFPFPLLVEEIEPQRRSTGTGLFRVLLNMPDSPHAGASSGELHLEGTRSEGIASSRGVSKFDLELYGQLGGGALALQLVYDLDLFEPETMEALLESLRELMERAAARPEAQLDELTSDLPLTRQPA